MTQMYKSVPNQSNPIHEHAQSYYLINSTGRYKLQLVSILSRSVRRPPCGPNGNRRLRFCGTLLVARRSASPSSHSLGACYPPQVHNNPAGRQGLRRRRLTPVARVVADRHSSCGPHGGREGQPSQDRLPGEGRPPPQRGVLLQEHPRG